MLLGAYRYLCLNTNLKVTNKLTGIMHYPPLHEALQIIPTNSTQLSTTEKLIRNNAIEKEI